MAGTKAEHVSTSKKASDMPPYMLKDAHGYRFRRSIPTDLRPFFNKSTFVKRLGSDFKVAKAHCAKLVVSTDIEIQSARASLKQSQAQDKDLKSFLSTPPAERYKSIRITPQLACQVASLWLHSLDSDLKSREAGLDDEEFED